MNKEETRKRFRQWCQLTIGNHCSDEDAQMFENIMALLDQDSSEQKTGTWIKRHDFWTSYDYWECSQCHTELAHATKYCPDCGSHNCSAKMVESEE